ncbi:MAG TPA: TOMM precursor leader peptide-binding protein [Mycobacteriales bacterium]|nr:TOMM precursor leader peptide-binding protein [Mycobacteriales bacterium]
MRPLLKPALRRLWRDPATLQLGIDPSYAVVLGGVDIADASLLDLLDGTRDVTELNAEAQRRGHDPERVDRLLKTLVEADALDDVAEPARPVDPRRTPDLLSLSLLYRAPGAAARVMAAREQASVEVLGAGRVGASVAMLLAAAGIRHLELSDNGPLRHADFAPAGIRSLGSRQGSRADAARVLLAGTWAKPKGAARADSTVVIAPTTSIVPPEWLGQVRHRPHLPVIIRETTAVIGPLVLPGQTPCLRCVELTRGDRDPAWPMMAAQLIGDRHGIEPCDVGLASAAASIVALHVLAWLDRGITAPPPSVGGIIELSLADLRLRRRTVAAHPGCGCGAIDAAPLPT